MWIKSLALTSFRNYSQLSLNFSPELNVFIGKNAQGKTNLLEAIYFLALSRSHRSRYDKDLIQFRKDAFTMQATICQEKGEVPVGISVNSSGRQISVNHLQQRRLSQYLGTIRAILFAPEDLQLIKGGPSLRRQFLDRDLGQLKPTYLSDLLNYRHILKQRNTYLKQTTDINHDFLDVLDHQLADVGSRIIKHRQDFVTHINSFVNHHHSHMSHGSEELSVTYIPSISVDNHDIFNTFVNHLHQNRQKDSRYRSTEFGPHRDDLLFSINDIPARFASQGQQRSIVLSIKLAEIDLMKETTGEAPLLLLDDVLSELDSSRQDMLLSNLHKGIQTFITTTNLDNLSPLPNTSKFFTITNGHVKTD